LDIFLQQMINGLTLGSVYAVVALGYTMVYGIIQLINFAHGEVVMIGAMVAFSVINALAGAHTGLPPLAIVMTGVLVAVPVCMAVGYTLERVAYRPLRNAPRLAINNGGGNATCSWSVWKTACCWPGMHSATGRSLPAPTR
jgi:branched-chain amino acid transport system permease protein